MPAESFHLSDFWSEYFKSKQLHPLCASTIAGSSTFAIRKPNDRVSMRADRAAEVRHHGVADVLESENFGINMEGSSL